MLPGFHLLLSLQVQTRNIRCLPDVLVINCEVNSSKEADFWKTQAEVGETLLGQKQACSPWHTGFAACPVLRRCFHSDLAVSKSLALHPSVTLLCLQRTCWYLVVLVA